MNVLQLGAAQQRFGMHPSADWQPIETAPRDGTVIEIICTYGVAPWYGLFQWTGKRKSSDQNGTLYEFETEPGWVDVRQPSQGVSDGPSIRWRPYSGEVSRYVDPTGGAQQDPAYWRGAAAAEHGLPLDYFEAQAKRNANKNDPNRPWWKRLFD